VHNFVLYTDRCKILRIIFCENGFFRSVYPIDTDYALPLERNDSGVANQGEGGPVLGARCLCGIFRAISSRRLVMYP